MTIMMTVKMSALPELSTRERLLAAAAEVFSERGYEGAALADIARRAQFTTGAIYAHFRDKAELLLEVVRGILQAQQDAALMASQGAALPERFVELAGEFVDPERSADRALVLEAHVAARRDREVAELLRSFQSDRLTALTAAVAEAQASGEVSPSMDPETVATLFLAIPLGLVLLDAAGVELPPATSWAELAAHTAEALKP